jgi:pimeloyl-ACP methyl ester carboxylesterase
MPTLEIGPVTIHYDTHGSGPALLLAAPGGMRSEARFWRVRPSAPSLAPIWIDPAAELSGDFTVIEMDQRNAGASRAPITAADGWPSYAADQLALLDHLGVDRFAVMGGCIGCAYALGLGLAAHGRVTAAVLQNPIGRSADNQALFRNMFDEWARERNAEPEAARAFREAMFGGDFVFSVSRDFVRRLPFPILVLPGDDDFHPRETALELAELAPRSEVFDPWRDDKQATAEVVRRFLNDAFQERLA